MSALTYGSQFLIQFSTANSHGPGGTKNFETNVPPGYH